MQNLFVINKVQSPVCPRPSQVQKQLIPRQDLRKVVLGSVTLLGQFIEEHESCPVREVFFNYMFIIEAADCSKVHSMETCF